MRNLLIGILFPAMLIGSFVHAEKSDDMAQKLALALVSGRYVTAVNQGLINDEAKGDKGFTADLFVAQLTKNYNEKTGIDLATIKPTNELNKLLIAYVKVVKEVINDKQELINTKGLKFKGFIPAVYGKKVGDAFYKETGVKLKQTSSKYRNRANKPDAFESEILAKFENNEFEKNVGYGVNAQKNGEEVYRYMQPIYIKEACLKCHGTPVGSLDIAGRKKEGYNIGDVRGAISVMLPLSFIK